MKFSIRDLLWLTVVVALAVGWWVSYRGLQDENSRLKKKEADRMLKELEEVPKPDIPILAP
jgi:hypothetical protein